MARERKRHGKKEEDNRKRFGAGPGGICICPNCQKEIEHQRGIPCYKTKCPDCGAPMTRRFE